MPQLLFKNSITNIISIGTKNIFIKLTNPIRSYDIWIEVGIEEKLKIILFINKIVKSELTISNSGLRLETVGAIIIPTIKS